MRKAAAASAFLDGINAASVALIAVVTWELLGSAIVDWTTLLIAGAGATALLRFRVNPAWIVVGGGLVGVVATSLVD
jgi:chromate transporter